MSHVKRMTKVKQMPAQAADFSIKECFQGFVNGEYPFFGETSFVDCVKCSKGGGSCADPE